LNPDSEGAIASNYAPHCEACERIRKSSKRCKLAHHPTCLKSRKCRRTIADKQNEEDGIFQKTGLPKSSDPKNVMRRARMRRKRAAEKAAAAAK